MKTGSNPEDKTKALQNHARHPPTGYSRFFSRTLITHFKMKWVMDEIHDY